MRQMLLNPSILLNPSSVDGKALWTEALSAANSSRIPTPACLSTGSYEGKGRGPSLWTRPGICSMNRPSCNPRVWMPQFKSMRRKLSVVPPMCHGEMEIVSVKELADGSLQFTFGLPTESTSKADDLSSINGEHLAGNLKSSSRLRSEFKKRTPVPVTAARRRKKLVEGPPSDKVSDNGVYKSSEVNLKLLSRPKSSFVKRSPIPQRKDFKSGHALSEASHPSSSIVNSAFSENQSHIGPHRERRSLLSEPLSQKNKAAEPVKEIERSTVRSLSSFKRVPGSSGVTSREEASAQLSRPRSKFSRRSPITKVGLQTAQKSSASESLPGESQRPRVHSHVHANSQVEAACADEASGNMDDFKDFGKSSDSESPSEFPLEFPAHSDLKKYKLPELKSIAKSRGLKGYSKLKKDELLDLLEKTGN